MHYQQAGLVIVALCLKEIVLDVREVKCNPDNFNKALSEEKAAFFSSKEKQDKKKYSPVSLWIICDGYTGRTSTS